MRELEVQKYLRGTGTLETLEATYAVKARRHSQWPNLVLLKYNQIESPFTEELVRECRGLILDEAQGWNVVCLTYTKFFNHGEGHAAPIDWSTAKVYEKLDGSLIQLYWYADAWRVATSGTPDADTPVGDFGTTFSLMFDEAARTYGLQWAALDRSCCYAFEICGPLNRVVVRHDGLKLYLHGVRDLQNGMELDPEVYSHHIQIPCAPNFKLGNFEDCVAAAAQLDPLAQEGYVVVDGAFNRVKIKSPAYVALHHAKDGLLSRRMMSNVIRTGEAEEFRTALDAFPELAGEFDKLLVLHEAVVFDAEVVYRQHVDIEDQKEFALKVKEEKISGVLFALRKQRLRRGDAIEPAIRGFLARLTDNAYGRLVGLKETEA